jgi:hypothetical protein
MSGALDTFYLACYRIATEPLSINHYVIKPHRCGLLQAGCHMAVGIKCNTDAAMGTVELKWAGYTMTTVAIMPRSERELDAFFIIHDSPNILQFNCFSDSSYYGMPILGYGDYVLTYVVISDNFPIARATVKVTIGNSVDTASLVTYP